MPNLITDVNAVLRGHVGLSPYGSTQHNHTGSGVTHVSDEEVSLLSAGEKNMAIGDESYVHDLTDMEAEQADYLAALTTDEEDPEAGLIPVEDKDGANIYLLEHPVSGERYRFIPSIIEDHLISMKTGRVYTLDELPSFDIEHFMRLYHAREETMKEQYFSLPEFFRCQYSRDPMKYSAETRSEALAVAAGRSVQKSEAIDRKHKQFYGNIRIH